MSEADALRVAIDLLHFPAKARKLREAPLSPGVEAVLQIAAGDDDVTEVAMQQLERTRETLVAAARFYVEQVLLAPKADSYRVLGAVQTASVNDLRRHMALMIKAMHPDAAPKPEQVVFVNRITEAWDTVKTPERRQAYDAQLAAAQPGATGTGSRVKSRRRGMRGQPSSSHDRQHDQLRPSLLRRMVGLFLGRSMH